MAEIDTERGGLPSASTLERTYNCAGHVAAEAEAPPEIPSDEAQEGIEIHEALENEDFTDLDEDGRTIAERLQALELKNVENFWPNARAGEIECHREKRLWIRDDNLNPLASAKLDVFRVYEKQALADDFKTGYLPTTPAGRNIQTRIQALAIWHEYPYLKLIRVGTAAYRFRGKAEHCDYRESDLIRAKQELDFHLWRSQQPHAQRNPGPWCRYCRARGMCREAAAFSLLPVPFVKEELKLTEDAIFAKVSQLSPQELVMLYDRKALIEKILEAATDRLKALPPDELRKVGRYLDNPGEKREITNVKKAWEVLYEKGLMTDPAELLALCKLPLGKVEEHCVPILQESGKCKTKKAAVEFVGNILSPAITKTPTAPRLKKLALPAKQLPS